MRNRWKLLLFGGLFLVPMTLNAQQSYFIDGYHGGVYGHYPKGYTRFMVEQLQRHSDWKINLEIEPETWDRERIEDPLHYNAFAEMIQDSVSRIEYVNPSYAQSYLFNCSAESTIRQFSMGLEKLREHFPNISFRSYSSEEPCFTAALPAILSSFGVKYASSKNPNTCWGDIQQLLVIRILWFGKRQMGVVCYVYLVMHQKSWKRILLGKPMLGGILRNMLKMLLNRE